MAEAITGSSLQQINQVKKRFFALNRERLMRTYASLGERHRNFLELLPLLFHVNHPSLPGYVSKNTPCGISDFIPSKRSIDAAKKHAKAFDQKRRALLRYDILALYLMGSSGTVAYSRKSDFDIWICHKPDLGQDLLDELQQKGTIIEEWAERLDLEVHFFLVNHDQMKQGIHEEMSSESSGSAQHFLLMEEFYRTGLLLAGRCPAWWLVPCEHESSYDNYLVENIRKRFISENEIIDFGAMPGVPAEEFFGAALWQLYKSIDSPYKSALKLLLMEVYAAEYPNVELLCHRFKRAIYQGETNLDELDPYIMLYRKLEEYLVGRGEEERLALLRRCFYFKVNEPLGKPDRPRIMSWRRELMRQVTQSWNWSQEYLEMLDSRQKWKIGRVIRERRILVKALTFSYQFLSDFAREHAQLVAINQKDLNLLGRKLYAAFERKAGKVEIVNRGISQDLWESHITFHKARGKDGREMWLLYAAPLNHVEMRTETPLKRSSNVTELMAWCHFNGMLDSSTVVAVHGADEGVSPRELKEMLVCLQRLFPVPKVLKANMEDFTKPARAEQFAVFVNLGIDPMIEHTRAGIHLTSDRNDALSYGGLYENLALSFETITVTSWREVLTARYTGSDGLLACLKDYLRWAVPGKGEKVPRVSAHCFSYGRGLTIQQRIDELFADITACFYGRDDSIAARYVLTVAHVHYLLYYEDESLRFEKCPALNDLLRVLGREQPRFQRLAFDRYALLDTPLPVIARANKARKVQLFYYVDGNMIDVYIFDERGSLFYQRMPNTNRQSLLNHYSLFFDSIVHRQYYEILGEGNSHGEIDAVEFYEVVERGRRNFALIPQEAPRQRRKYRYFNIQVIADLVEGEPSFTIYCDDTEFSSAEYHNDLYQAVAAHVFERRKSGERYPIFITDLDLPFSLLGDSVAGDQVQTIHFLNYKRRIEKSLYDALQALVLT